ncbi:hypothetical protein ACOMHN_026170 [Nucella lapillus]
MVRISSGAMLILLVVLVSMVTISQANWYGKRSDRADFLNFLMKQESVSRGMDPEVALAAIDQVLQLYRHRKADNAISS